MKSMGNLLVMLMLTQCKGLVTRSTASPQKLFLKKALLVPSSVYSDILPYHTATGTGMLQRRHSKTSPQMSIPAAATQQLIRTTLGTAVAYSFSTRGLRRKSLTKSGAIAAFCVSSVAVSCSIRTAFTLIMFYLTSSKLTSIGFSKKEKIEEDYSVEGSRGASQVLACSLFGVLVSLVRRLIVGLDGPLVWDTSASVVCLGNRLTLACVGFFACCAGDTWASELGVLAKHQPRLFVSPWRSVPPGTNGAVSWEGLAASAAGGMCMGLCYGTCLFNNMREVLILAWVGTLAGLGGSLLDSVLGATVQATYYDVNTNMIVKRPSKSTRREGLAFLSNEAVNFVSTAGTAILAGVFAKPLLGWFVV